MGSGNNPGVGDEHTAAGVAREGVNGGPPAQTLEGSLPWELSYGGVTAWKDKKDIGILLLSILYLTG